MYKKNIYSIKKQIKKKNTAQKKQIDLMFGGESSYPLAGYLLFFLIPKIVAARLKTQQIVCEK